MSKSHYHVTVQFTMEVCEESYDAAQRNAYEQLRGAGFIRELPEIVLAKQRKAARRAADPEGVK